MKPPQTMHKKKRELYLKFTIDLHTSKYAIDLHQV